MPTFTKLKSGSCRVQVRRKREYVANTFIPRPCPSAAAQSTSHVLAIMAEIVAVDAARKNAESTPRATA
jgi:hypothetical protein